MCISNGSLFSILILCKIINKAWCIAMVFILLEVHFMVFSGILNFASLISLRGCV